MITKVANGEKIVRLTIILIVGLAWLMSVTADIILLNRYSPSPYMHMIMGTVVTALVGKQILKRGGPDE